MDRNEPRPRDGEVCAQCGAPATRFISAPADTGPFTNCEMDNSLTPSVRWDMPLCDDDFNELSQVVTCNTCWISVPSVDAVFNSSGTIQLCRPCNAKENQ